MLGYRSVLPLLGGLCLVYIGLGAVIAVLPLSMVLAQTGAFAIGAVAALFAAGFLGGLLAAPRVLAVLGHVRMFAMAAALAGVATLVASASQFEFVLAVVRLITGFCLACAFMAGDGWLASVMPPNQRPQGLWIYTGLAFAGLIIGVFVAGGLGVPGGYALAAGAFALAIVPALATTGGPKTSGVVPALAMPALVNAAPSGAVACFLSALSWSAVLALAVPFADVRAGGAALAGVGELAAGILGAVLLGAALALVPLSWLARRGDVRKAIGILAAIAGFAAFVLALTPFMVFPLVMTLCALWGACVFGGFVLGTLHMAARVGGGRALNGMAGCVLMFVAGSIVGPLLGGVFMAIPLVEGAGLFWFIALAMAGLSLFMFHRRAVRPEAGEMTGDLDEESDWVADDAGDAHGSDAMDEVGPGDDDDSGVWDDDGEPAGHAPSIRFAPLFPSSPALVALAVPGATPQESGEASGWASGEASDEETGEAGDLHSEDQDSPQHSAADDGLTTPASVTAYGEEAQQMWDADGEGGTSPDDTSVDDETPRG